MHHLRYLALLSVASATAQVNPPSDTPAVSTSETVLLTPFVVATDQDHGYVATNTLSGTRINTRVKDVGSQISVFTSDFLRDIGATNIEEAADYALGTQRDFSEEGSEISATQTGLKNSNASFRVRGFTGVGRSRNFFNWAGPEIDVSTLERIDFSRGPNSILFGLGNPSGIFNASLKRANLDRNFQRLDLRGSNFNQRRATLDVNVRTDDKTAAVRVVPLYDHTGTWREHEFRHREGVFGAVAFTPFKRTTVRLDFERGRISEVFGRTYTAMDGTSAWEDAGRPVLPATAFTVATNPATGITSARPTTAVVNSRATGYQPYSNRALVPAGEYVFVFDADNGFAANWSVMPTGTGPLFLGTASSFLYNSRNEISTDPKYVLNRLPRQTMLLGPSLPFTQDYRTGSLAVEHAFRPNLAFELALNRTLVKRDNYDLGWNFNALASDASGLRPDGQVNPNAGRYFIASTIDQNRSSHQGNQARATLSYILDLNRRNQWLGRYNLAVLGDVRETHDRGENRREVIYKNAPFPGSTVADNRNRVFRRNYVDPDKLDSLRLADYRLTPIDDVHDASRGLKVSSALLPVSGTTERKQRTTSGMFVGQAFLLRDYVVATFGRREDRLRQIGFDTVFDTVGDFTNVPRAVLNPSRVERFSGNTMTKGLVVHPREWLSLFYNESSNFNINAGGSRLFATDPSGSSLVRLSPNSAGLGRDVGIRLSGLWGGRLFLTYNAFRNSGENILNSASAASNLNGYPRNMIFAVYSHNPALLQGTGLREAFDQVFNTTTNTVTHWTSSRKTEGHEVELTANLSRQWRLMVGYSKSKTRLDNVAPEVAAFLQRYNAFFTRPDIAPMRFNAYNTVAVLGSGALGSAGMPVHDTSPVSDAQQNDYAASRSASTTGVAGPANLVHTVGEAWQYNRDVLEENVFSRTNARPVGEVPEQYSLRTNYRFTGQRLKGVSIGGGLRWRAGQVLGALATRPNDVGVQRPIPYAQRPTIRGDAVFLNDLNVGYERKLWRNRVNWEIQLNVTNLLNERDAAVIANYPDGRPRWYRWIEPRRVMVSSSLAF